MKDKDKMIWVSGIGIAVVWLGLLIAKSRTEESISNYFWIISGITVLYIAYIIIGKFEYFKKKIKEKENILEPISEKELRERHKKIIEEAGNYILKGMLPETKSVTVNNNIMYYTKINLYRPVSIGDNIETSEIVFIDNATFPQIRTQVIPFTKNKEKMAEEILEAINKMSKDWSNPDIHEVEETTDSYGKPIRKTKVTSFNKKEEDKTEGEVV